jgi:hypothetical protein
MAWAHAATRVAVGTSLLAAPSRAGRPWLGPAADSGGGRVALQAFAVREAAIGIGLLRLLATGGPVRLWFRLALAFEVVDAAATAAQRRELPDTGFPDAVALFALSGVVGGSAVALLLDE